MSEGTSFGRPAPREGGLWRGEFFWLRLTTASAVVRRSALVKLLSRTGSLVSRDHPVLHNSKENPLSGGVIYTSGGKNLRYSTEIAVYLGHGTR